MYLVNFRNPSKISRESARGTILEHGKGAARSPGPPGLRARDVVCYPVPVDDAELEVLEEA